MNNSDNSCTTQFLLSLIIIAIKNFKAKGGTFFLNNKVKTDVVSYYYARNKLSCHIDDIHIPVQYQFC